MESSEKKFSEAVYEVVARIPKGSTLSYGSVAESAGFPGAARAVGSLMKKNYDPKIPCHRVIRSDGRVGAYNRGGKEEKAKRLRQEGVSVERRVVSEKSIWSVRYPRVLHRTEMRESYLFRENEA